MRKEIINTSNWNNEEVEIKVFEEGKDEYYQAVHEGMTREAKNPFEAMAQIVYNIY